MLINICGIDGCGKSTQALLLKENLENIYNRECIVLHGFKPRKYAQELYEFAKENNLDYYAIPGNLRTILFLVDAMINTKELIIPALNNGKIVIMEKYYSDTIVYGPSLGADISLIKVLCQYLPEPDLTFILDVSPEHAVERVELRKNKGEKNIALKEHIEFADYARNAYSDYYQQLKTKSSVYMLNGEDTIDDIGNKILNVCMQFLV